MNLSGARVLVTGGTRRLGLSLAEGFASAGCAVAATVRGGDNEVRLARKRVSPGVLPISGDMSAGSVDEVVASATDVLGGPIDVLVNNAAAFEFDSLETASFDGINSTLGVNVAAPVMLTQAVTRLPRDSAGLILNVLDYKLASPFPGFLSYTISKFALKGFTLTGARELAPAWRVCGVAPGYTLPGPDQPIEEFEANRDATPLRRGSRPDDIVEAALFLARSDAVTGQVLVVDGGAHMLAQERDFLFADDEAPSGGGSS